MFSYLFSSLEQLAAYKVYDKTTYQNLTSKIYYAFVYNNNKINYWWCIGKIEVILYRRKVFECIYLLLWFNKSFRYIHSKIIYKYQNINIILICLVNRKMFF